MALKCTNTDRRVTAESFYDPKWGFIFCLASGRTRADSEGRRLPTCTWQSQPTKIPPYTLRSNASLINLSSDMRMAVCLAQI